MALIKRILVFLLSLVCIIIFFSVTTSSYAVSYPVGAGRGTLDCGYFIETTTQLDEDGELDGRSYIYRLEYVQWAYGFLTAIVSPKFLDTFIIFSKDFFSKFIN